MQFLQITYFSVDFNDTTNKGQVWYDSLNVIMLSSSIGTSNAATSIGAKIHQPSASLKPVAGIVDIDIEINSSKIFFYDTTGTIDKPAGKLDFFRTILHELGHALQLDHLTDKTELMYYASKSIPSFISYLNRDLNFSSYNNLSGDYVVDKSVNQNLQNVGALANLPMILKDTCLVMPLETNNLSNTKYLDILLYPNPTHSNINIEINNNDSKEIIIHDITGKVIARINTRNRVTNFDVTSFSKGLYIVVIKSNNLLKTIKFICD
jgi:Secretion system C-terminal sorting domain